MYALIPFILPCAVEGPITDLLIVDILCGTSQEKDLRREFSVGVDGRDRLQQGGRSSLGCCRNTHALLTLTHVQQF